MPKKKQYAKTYHRDGWIGMLENEEQYEGLKSGRLSFKEHISGKMKAIQIPPELFYRLMELDKAVTAIPFEMEVYPRPNVGDKAYFVIEDTEEIYVSAEEITDVSIKGFFVNGDCELNPYSDIGKTVFLNPEDADAECERLRNSKAEKDYDFEEICPHCDFVNEVAWDGKSRTVVCAGCGKEIVLCSACEDMRCGNCRYEKELSKNGGVQDNE